MSETIRNALRENYGLVDIESEDKILALFPSWKTFSNDCKPDKRKEIWVRYADGSLRRGELYWDISRCQWCDKETYEEYDGMAYDQFFEIP